MAPTATLVPGSGSWLMTSPAGTSALKASVGAPTRRASARASLDLVGGTGQVGHGHGLDAQADAVADGGAHGHAGARLRDPG